MKFNLFLTIFRTKNAEVAIEMGGQRDCYVVYMGLIV